MLRQRKNKRYNEGGNDEEGDRSLRYDIRDKIRSKQFEHLRDLLELTGEQVTLKLVQRNGFDKPILVTKPAGLDLSVPQKGFVVRDVGKLVGYDRTIDVMDVRTQKNIEMSMRDWCKYYESRSKDRLLNVISLEFSHTELASQVDSPRIVKLLDWVDLVWPKFLKESQTESTNTIDKMKYPKVQKYCLMSVKGSYTDFHIDFGGTSVWYHILRGKKIFWMAPPTELNLHAFEEWTLSGYQQDVFFGDTVEECFRVELSAGNTFFIPSGWIHAVYTVEDSLVFGGNFLHSFGIENQLKVSKIEDATKVPVKFRYPFYTEILWYVVQHYVFCLTGKSHLQNSPKNSTTTTPEKNSKTIIETKEIKERPKIVANDSATESEHYDSDKKTKRKKIDKSEQSRKKRGRPRKAKVPTDDESTEIDSDYEDTKPTKSSATCRMTKNSLLRLQYDLDEPQASIGQSPPNRSSKPSKTESVSEESVKKSKTRATQSPIKTEVTTKSDLLQSSNNSTQAEASASETLTSISSGDTSRLNGWSGANKSIWSNSDLEPKGPHKIHITKTELNGLKLLVKHLSKLSGAKKNMPNLIRNSRALLDDCKKVIAEHENDDPELAVTGLAITPDLLNPKKSDINQLIEQFFKPSDAAPNDEMSNDKAKTDSTTLTMQHRLKYNQMNNHVKVDDRKISSPSNDGVSLKTPSHKDFKTSNSNKKSTSSSSPTLSTSNHSSNVPATAVDQPRPKSPPTRPLSNKQYSSKTKNDKSDNSLVLPGSFADLIAATSAPKEVFNVSSADVTSSLFGLKSPSKSSLTPKDEQPTSSKTPQRSSFNIDSILPSTNLDSSKDQLVSKKDESPKPSSLEPPKITAPAKRFITPAQNRLQVKEKLIYASAPYVSPVNASDHPRTPYMWQNSANMQTPHHNLQPHQQSRPPNQFPPSHNTSTLPQPIEPPKPSPSQANAARLVSKQTTNQIESAPSSSEQQQKMSSSPSDPNHKQPVQESFVNQVSDKNDAREEAEPLSTNGSHKSSDSPTIAPKVDYKTSESQAIKSSKSNLPVPSHLSSLVSTSITQPVVSVDDQKVKKPRGPPKKSKEARQVIETDSTDPNPAVPISVIKLNAGGQPPMIIRSNPPSSIDNSPSVQNVANSKEKSKVKRAKKKDQSDAVSSSSASKDSSANSLQTPSQARPPVNCGLVAPPAATTNSAPQLPKAGQQYLISRPVLFNTMPAFSSAHLPQHLHPTSMPLFTTSMPSSMGLHNMQPGARILWATRPQAPAPVSSASFVPRPAAAPPAQPKKKVSKPATPTSTQVRQPDNAALLSLATTALSSAPLPTPTLSNIGARLPNPAQQAYMVNPNMFIHQYYNPFMQQIPMVHFGPGATSSAALMAGTQFRPGIPRPSVPAGRLLFAPLANQTGQPRYLITQPGFMPRPQAAPLYSGHQTAPNLPFVAFQPTVGPSSTKESAKVKKVKTR